MAYSFYSYFASVSLAPSCASCGRPDLQTEPFVRDPRLSLQLLPRVPAPLRSSQLFVDGSSLLSRELSSPAFDLGKYLNRSETSIRIDLIPRILLRRTIILQPLKKPSIVQRELHLRRDLSRLHVKGARPWLSTNSQRIQLWLTRPTTRSCQMEPVWS